MTQYSDQAKAEALAALDANGGNVSKTAKALGIPRVTLLQWRDGQGVSQDVSQIRHHKKEELAECLEALLHKVIGCIPAKLETASLHELNGTLKIGAETMQLLRGAPTSIQGTQDLTDDERRRRLAELFDRARARAGMGATDAGGTSGGPAADSVH